MKRRALVIVLIGAGVVAAVLIASAVITTRMTSEVQEVVKMQSLAAVVADNLEGRFRATGSFPEKLNEIQFRDNDILSALGVSRSDLDRFSYSSDRRTFKLQFESSHYRFSFASDGVSGLTAEPLTRKN